LLTQAACLSKMIVQLMPPRWGYVPVLIHKRIGIPDQDKHVALKGRHKSV
jgi:hypothetical protein